MIFWLTALGIAGIVAFVVSLALLRPAGSGARAAAEYDLAIYRDQLAEVDRDLARGVIAKDDAERARVEISRRILDAGKALESADGMARAPGFVTALASGAISAALVLGAAGIYWQIGAPGAPDLPLQERKAKIAERAASRPGQEAAEARVDNTPPPPEGASQDYLDLVEKLRKAVANRPDDLQGHRLLARHEAALGRFAAAWRAQARVVELLGEGATADDIVDQAELMIIAANGYVSPEAEAVLARALDKDRMNPRARYYSGLLLAQTGRPDLALRFWESLLAESTTDDPWVEPIMNQIGQVAAMAGMRPPQVAPRPAAPADDGLAGPSAADVEAAQSMSAGDRATMIRNMVARLSERLATEGGTAAEWARLIRAYGVLGESEKAGKAWADAQAALAEDPQGLATARDAARAAGVAD